MTGPFRDEVINAMQVDGKMSEMGETSAATAYLLSSDSKYISGLSLPVGHGMENNLIQPAIFTAGLGKAFAAMGAAAAEAEAAKSEL